MKESLGSFYRFVNEWRKLRTILKAYEMYIRYTRYIYKVYEVWQYKIRVGYLLSLIADISI